MKLVSALVVQRWVFFGFFFNFAYRTRITSGWSALSEGALLFASSTRTVSVEGRAHPLPLLFSLWHARQVYSVRFPIAYHLVMLKSNWDSLGSGLGRKVVGMIASPGSRCSHADLL